MQVTVKTRPEKGSYSDALPKHRQLYYGGGWHEPGGGYMDTYNPADRTNLGPTAVANREDVHQAVLTAQRGFQTWRHLLPQDRGALLRKIATIVRENAEELALVDAANGGSPIGELVKDSHASAAYLEYFAGAATEVKGSSAPLGESVINMTVREPLGVCARILAYNHPLMFLCIKMAPALAVGNTVIMKPPVQAPLSAYRLLELIDGILPPGVLNVLTGGAECGEALTRHPDIPLVSLVGSVATGRAIMRAASDRLKRVLFELGGKNAMIVYPDADIERAVAGAVRGMNLGWAGQSCGSTSRLFIHEAVYDRVVDQLVQGVKVYRPGIPTHPSTTMGSLISQQQYEKVMSYIEIGKSEGAKLVLGGTRPEAPELGHGFFVEPTIFVDVKSEMRIAQEEIFGPVLSVLKWSDEDEMLAQVNSVEYGLTGAIYTTSLANAHRAAGRMAAGLVWVNNSSQHFPGWPFGGYKQSGIGREESIEELLEFTQVKNININL